MPWNHETQTFDPPREWPIEPEDLGEFGEFGEDQGAAQGLVIGCGISLVVWLGGAAIWHWSWLRRPAASVAIVFVILGALYAVNTHLIEPWRRRHADSDLVARLNRWGL